MLKIENYLFFLFLIFPEALKSIEDLVYNPRLTLRKASSWQHYETMNFFLLKSF